LKEVALELPLSNKIIVTGGAVNDTLITAKIRWMKNATYSYKEQSSMLGAALLAKSYVNKN
jgi:hypothetical protein